MQRYGYQPAGPSNRAASSHLLLLQPNLVLSLGFLVCSGLFWYILGILLAEHMARVFHVGTRKMRFSGRMGVFATRQLERRPMEDMRAANRNTG